MTTEPRCSFCNKPQTADNKSIVGPNGAAICRECVDVCNDIIADGPRFRAQLDGDDTAGPPEMLSFRCPACGHKWAIDRK